MRIKAEEAREVRGFTNKMLEGLDFGLINADSLARELLEWLSEDEVEEFSLYYEYIETEDEDEDADE